MLHGACKAKLSNHDSPSDPAQRRRMKREITTLLLEFLARSVTLRSADSITRLEYLVEGYETYVYYDLDRLDRSGGVLYRGLTAAYGFAMRRLCAVQTGEGHRRRCERAARRLRPDWGQRGSGTTPVLFTLMFVLGDRRTATSRVLHALVERYRIAGGETALLLAPRWFYEALLVHWPSVCWGSQNPPRGDDSSLSEEAIRAAAYHAGMSPEALAEGVDIEGLKSLWDPDPLQTFFDLHEALLVLDHL